MAFSEISISHVYPSSLVTPGIAKNGLCQPYRWIFKNMFITLNLTFLRYIHMKLWKTSCCHFQESYMEKWDLPDLQLKLDYIYKISRIKGLWWSKRWISLLKYFILIVDSFHISILEIEIFLVRSMKKTRLKAFTPWPRANTTSLKLWQF